MTFKLAPEKVVRSGVTMSEEEFALLRDFVHERTGIFVDEHNRSLLEFKLSPRLQIMQMETFADYHKFVSFHPRARDEIPHLISAITNNESYFFREIAQIDVLIKDIVPAAVHGPTGKSVYRVLCAGCSTGEEPYTLAMSAIKNDLDIKGIRLEVTGMDIDNAAIARANGAVYRPFSLRNTSDGDRDEFFKPFGSNWALNEKVKETVTFTQGNIIERASFLGLGTFDAVFCRNVFIYFSEEMITRAISHFTGVLNPGGHVFLGHSESLIHTVPQLQPVRMPGALFYKVE